MYKIQKKVFLWKTMQWYEKRMDEFDNDVSRKYIASQWDILKEIVLYLTQSTKKKTPVNDEKVGKDISDDYFFGLTINIESIRILGASHWIACNALV